MCSIFDKWLSRVHSKSAGEVASAAFNQNVQYTLHTFERGAQLASDQRLDLRPFEHYRLGLCVAVALLHIAIAKLHPTNGAKLALGH